MIGKLTLWIACIALGLLSGCATLPSPEQMQSEVAGYQLPRSPEGGKAMVYVVRPSQLGALIRFNVFLDDEEERSEMGYTRGGQHIYFNVPPGSHKLFSKAENTAEMVLTLKPGEVAFVQQEPAMGIIMARNSLFRLDEVQGKWSVKNTSPGTILKTEK